jgi:hypothetical protein
MAKLIGIKGLIGSGKSTVAKILVDKYNMVEYSIAGPLKEFAKSIGFKHHQVYGSQEQKLELNKDWGISGRRFMQKFGTDIVREGIPNVIPEMKLNNKTLWIRSFEINVLNNNENIVVPDVRFKDEADTIVEHGGYIIEIVDEKIRDNLENKEKSELSIKEITPHIIINNIGTLEDLDDMIYRCICIIDASEFHAYPLEDNICNIYPINYKSNCYQKFIRMLNICIRKLQN